MTGSDRKRHIDEKRYCSYCPDFLAVMTMPRVQNEATRILGVFVRFFDYWITG